MGYGLALRKLNGGDRPLSIVAPDRDSQTVMLVKPNLLHRPGLSIGEDYGLADKLSLGLTERAEDRGRTEVDNWHGWFRPAPLPDGGKASSLSLRMLACLFGGRLWRKSSVANSSGAPVHMVKLTQEREIAPYPVGASRRR
jgi:hypothetical protein